MNRPALDTLTAAFALVFIALDDAEAALNLAHPAGDESSYTGKRSPPC